MELRMPFYDLNRQEPEATFGALVEILLKSRLKIQLETNKGFYDEDVNAYLAGVLCEYIDPQYQLAVRQCVAERDTDVFLNAACKEDDYRTYWVYKVNADDRLIDLGIFHPHREHNAAVLGQAKAYYGFASGYNHRLYGRATAVSDILEKLSRWAERYVSILNQARRDYLSFVETVRVDDLRDLHHDVVHEAALSPLKAKQDAFLDAYSTWLKASTPEAKEYLLKCLEDLRQLDPLFCGPSFLKPDEEVR